ncbi:MAG: hypothetical protein ABIO70_30365 [Pseudomonadota bacterium]
MNEQQVDCIHCLAPGMARLRYDRAGRPYTVCLACGTRSFMHCREALAGVLSMAPRLAAILRQRGQTVEDYRREVLAVLDAPAAASGGAR